MESLKFSKKLELKVKQVVYAHVHKLLWITGQNQGSALKNDFGFNYKTKKLVFSKKY